MVHTRLRTLSNDLFIKTMQILTDTQYAIKKVHLPINWLCGWQKDHLRIRSATERVGAVCWQGERREAAAYLNCPRPPCWWSQGLCTWKERSMLTAYRLSLEERQETQSQQEGGGGDVFIALSINASDRHWSDTRAQRISEEEYAHPPVSMSPLHGPW